MALLQMELYSIPAATFHLQNAVLKHVQKAQSNFNAHLNSNDILKKSAFTSKPSLKNVCMSTTQKMTSSKILLVDTVLWRVVFLGWMNKHIQIKIHEHIEEQQNVSKADLASLPIIFYSYWFERKYFYVFYGKCVHLWKYMR